MDMKINYRVFICMASLMWLSSCISEDSNMGDKEVSTISIVGSDAETMPVVNVTLGELCVIEPEVTVKGASEQSLSYKWSIGTYRNQVKGKLEEVGREKVLNYSFKEGGGYYAHLVVSNEEAGRVIEYQINVNRPFEEGILIASNDADGSANLGFISAADYSIREHSIEYLNPELKLKNLVGAGRMNYNMSFNGPIMDIVAVSTEDKCYVFEATTLELMNVGDYHSIDPNFKASNFTIVDSYMGAPVAYDKDSKSSLHIDPHYGLVFQEQDAFFTEKFEDIFWYYYDYWGTPYMAPVGVDYSTSTVYHYEPYATLDGEGNLEASFSDLNILSVMKKKEPEGDYSTCPVYVIGTAKDNSEKVKIYELEYLIDEETEAFYFWQAKLITDYECSPETVLPAKGQLLVESPTSLSVFYTIGNKLYVFYPYNPSPTFPTSAALTFDEEITSLSINDATDEVYIGTYNATTKRGSIYIYDAGEININVTAQPKRSFLSCVGRIESICYKNRPD